MDAIQKAAGVPINNVEKMPIRLVIPALIGRVNSSFLDEREKAAKNGRLHLDRCA